eukprot:Nitzschia sp. Nitz4//scaffold150_size53981//39416//40753//NITZ4_006683-RA/size53981-processed-gene-0.35-mRNA-1//-1//CDS//3329537089//7146//frame0
MGGNRKQRGGQQQQHQHTNSSSSNNSTNHHNTQPNNGNLNRHSDSSESVITKTDDAEEAQPFDFNKLLQEVDGGFQITWRELLMALFGIVVLVILSIFMGISAGMTISVHYYEGQAPAATRRLNSMDASSLYAGSSENFKVTTLDPDIASANILQQRDSRDGLDLGKVITTTPSGQLKMLMVVDEATPLQPFTCSTPPPSNAPPGSSNAPPPQFHSQATPMTTEQAEHLVPGYSRWKESQPKIEIREPTVLPTVCSDGYTVGFDDWNILKAAVHEANSISAERFMKWSEYFATTGNDVSAFEDDLMYYEEDVVFTICPRARLRARKGPIYINAENVVIECDGCIIDVGGTHLNFGPHAKNILVRGLTFRRAQSSSLTFYHDGADASFEDCSWYGNSGSSGKKGGVADVNSTSVVNFYRCDINQAPKAPVLSNMNIGNAPSLTIRK